MTNNSVDMSYCSQNNGNDDYESDYEYNDDNDNNSVHDDEGSTVALSNSITHNGDSDADNDDEKQHNNSSKVSSDNDNDNDNVDDNVDDSVNEEEDEYEYNYSDDDDDDHDDDTGIKEEPFSSSITTSSSSMSSATTAAATAAATAALSSTSLSSSPTKIATMKKKNKRKQPSSSAKIELVPAGELLPEMNHRIQEVHEALGVPLEASSPLLRIHGWSVQSLLQNYFDNPEKLLKEAGVFQRCSSQEVEEQDPAITKKKAPSPRRTRSTTLKASEIVTSSRECSICMDGIDVDGGDNNSSKKSTSLKMNCGHEFCLDCWEDYIINAIEYEGATCILATCPESTCNEVITEKEISFIVENSSNSNNSNQDDDDDNNNDDDDERLSLLTKFYQYQLRSFVDSNDLARWCPGKGCNRVAHLTCISPGFKFGRHNNNEPALQFVMKCIECNDKDNNPNPNSGFCLPCGEEQHLPATCHQISRWNDKNSNDSQTANWITVNTKTCPKCHTRINKDGGCMYMTCRNCRHGFCWICMGTHHVMSCNAFKEGDADDDTNRAKNELERYLHHHERYKGHAEAQKYVIQQIIKLNELEKVSEPTTFSSTTAAAVCTPPKSSPTSSPTKTAATTTTTNTKSTTTGGSGGGDVSKEGGVIVDFPATPKELFDIRVRLKQANEQLLICRRVLKFTYVFSFYKFKDAQLKTERNCFEHHQGILEGLTESLSKICETNLNLETTSTATVATVAAVAAASSTGNNNSKESESPESTSMDDITQDIANQTRSIKVFTENVLGYVDNGLQL